MAAHAPTQDLERHVVANTIKRLLNSALKLNDNFDRSKVPALDPQKKPTFPTIWKDTLGREQVVHGIEDNQLPLVNIRIVVPGGSCAETRSDAGVAEMLTYLLVRGPQGMTQADFEKTQPSWNGIEYTDFLCDWEINVNLLREHLDEGLSLLEQVLQKPAFRPSDLDKLRQDFLLGFEQEKTHPKHCSQSTTTTGSVTSSTSWTGFIRG